MKNINYKYFFFILISVILLSCGDDDKSSTEPGLNLEIDQALVGTWDLTKITTSATGTLIEFLPEQLGIASTSTFNSDGTFESTNTEPDGTVVDTGTWGINDGVLYIMIEGEETETSSYILNGNVVTIESTVPFSGAEIPATLEFTKRT